MNADLKEPAFSRGLTVAAWVLLPTWLYIHAFVWAANSGGSVAHHLGGPPWWLFMVASVVGLCGGPIWLVTASAAFLLEVRRKEWPEPRHGVLFAALGALMVGYWYLASLD